MEFLTVAKMKELEAQNAALGLSYGEMMENAGRNAAQIVAERFSPGGKQVLVLCGRGNNGGDGMVSARYLSRMGAAVAVALPFGEPKTQEAQAARDRLEETGAVPVTTLPEECFRAIPTADLILDCLFGTGFVGSPAPEVCRLMEAVNRSSVPVISYDIPSGVEADTGRYDACIRSDLVIAFQALKPALLVHWRREYLKEALVAPIGTPPEVSAGFDGFISAIDGGTFSSARPVRREMGHKGTNGRLAVVAGSRAYRGAAALCCRAALRSGVGYVHLASVEEVCALVLDRSPEVLCTSCSAAEDGTLSQEGMDAALAAVEGADAVVLGCGLGNSPTAAEIVRGVLHAAKKPVVLDADGLNILAQNITLLKETRAPLILTPHPGEFSRLFGLHINEVTRNPIHWAQTIAGQYGFTLLLKGPVTVISDGGERTAVSFLGNSGLARAGSGDVLSGIIGAMAARGLDTMDAACCGAYLHGRAADLTAERWTREAMLPSDLIETLPQVFQELELGSRV